jgi:hypothetical protein
MKEVLSGGRIDPSIVGYMPQAIVIMTFLFFLILFGVRQIFTPQFNKQVQHLGKNLDMRYPECYGEKL